MKRRRRYKRKQRTFIVITTLSLVLLMSIGYSAFSTNINLSAKGNIKDKSRVIQSWNENSNEDFHTEFYRENIVSVTFLNSSVVPNNAVEKWDVSETKDKGVMAYVTESTSETGKYDLYIGAKNGVIANPDSSYLFYDFEGVKEIKFNSNFDTAKALTLKYMFCHCKNLRILDLSTFNTSEVTIMGGLFEDCTNLEYVDISNFDTSNVRQMWFMFSKCDNLTELNLGNFNTSNTTQMQSMFADAKSLKELNLCTFNMQKIDIIDYMFFNTPNVSNVYVGNNWVIGETTNTENLFQYSNVSSVTAGKCPD